MKKRIACTLAGLLSVVILQMPVLAYENAETDIFIEASSSEVDESDMASSDDDINDDIDDPNEDDAASSETSELDKSEDITSEESSDSSSELITSSAVEASDEIISESWYQESKLYYGSPDQAASMLASMEIVAINGRTYHISDFSEEYICVFFGRSGCGNTRAMTQKAAQLRDNGRSIRIIVMDIDSADDGLSEFASSYSAVASLNSPYNNNLMWRLYNTAIGGSGSVTLPVAFVLDADRDVIYSQTGYDATGLEQTLAGNDPAYRDDTQYYEFRMKYGQSEARSMLSDINAFRTGNEAWAWNSSNTTKVYYDARPLTYDYGLEVNAMIRAAEIAISYSHTRPNGESCFTAYTNQSGAHGENIAYGYTNANSVFAAWREDNDDYSGQGHRRNMLGAYSYVGIGHVYFNGTHYWVQEFSSAPTDLTQSTPFDSNTKVTVEILDSNIYGSSYRLDSYDYYLQKGESESLPTVYKTLTVPNGTVDIEEITPTWSISDQKVATISGNKVKAVGGGTARLTASYDNWSDSVEIYVTAEVESITLNKTSLSLYAGDSEKLKATVLPDDANDKTVYWYSDNSSVASVASDGTVTAKKSGTAIITAYSSNGLEAECRVTVNKKVTYTDGLHETNDGWYLFKNDKVDTSYNGLYCDASVGWWLVLNGRVAFEYNDLYCDLQYGWWKVAGGTVDFGYSDLYESPSCGWWLVTDGYVNFGYTDLYYSPTCGWWLVTDGYVNFDYTDLYYSPTCGWWLVNGGWVNFGYNDLYYSPTCGWWLVTDGYVNFGYTDLYYSPTCGWWLVSGGAVDFGYTDVYRSYTYGDWKVAGGGVDFGYNGGYNSQRYGKCYVSGGAASF